MAGINPGIEGRKSVCAKKSEIKSERNY